MRLGREVNDAVHQTSLLFTLSLQDHGHQSVIPDVPVYELVASSTSRTEPVMHILQAFQVACVGEHVEVDDVDIGVVFEDPPNEV